MGIKINVDDNAKKQRVETAFGDAVTQIKENAGKGSNTTELYIDNDIASDVKEKLQNEVERIQFCVVDSRFENGVMHHFTGKRIGDQRFYKVSIN